MNEKVDVHNASFDRGTGYDHIHPKLCEDGRYPFGFDAPVTLDQLLQMPEHHLGRIIESYGIPEHRDSLRGGHDRLRSRGFPDEYEMALAVLGREEKLVELLRFLGAGEAVVQLVRTSLGGSTRSWYPDRRGLIGSP